MKDGIVGETETPYCSLFLLLHTLVCPSIYLRLITIAHPGKGVIFWIFVTLWPG